MLETPQQFAKDLIDRVCLYRPPLPKLIGHDRGKATQAVAKILRLMATKRGYKFHPFKLRKRRELLCDFIWLRWQRSHPMRLKDIELVAECEWIHRRGGRHLLYDFQKLLPLKARVKLFIYMIPPRAKKSLEKKTIDKIESVVRGYDRNLPGESFFLLGLDRRRNCETVSVYHLRIPRKKTPNVVFIKSIVRTIDCS